MIINVNDIRLVRPIAENVNDSTRLLPYIDECENLYLKKSIGNGTYNEIDRNRQNYNLLFDGGEYGENQSFAGLKKAMGYLVYSRFIRNQNVNVTAFGIVAKQGQYSEAVDERTIIRISNDTEKIGLEYLAQCVEYLQFLGIIEGETKKISRTKYKVIGS